MAVEYVLAALIGFTTVQGLTKQEEVKGRFPSHEACMRKFEYQQAYLRVYHNNVMFLGGKLCIPSNMDPDAIK